MNFLRNLSVLKKQALIVLLLLVPLAGAMTWLVRADNADITGARLRIDGYTLNQPLEEINSGLADHMAAVASALAGAEGAAKDLTETQGHVDEALASAIDFKAPNGLDFGIAGNLKGLQEHWNALKARSTSLALEDALAQHEALLSELEEINEQMMERSQMLLVPTLETYYMADVAGNLIPGTERAIGRLVSRTVVAANTRQPSAEQLLQVRLQAEAVDKITDSLEDELATGMESGTHRATLGPKVTASLAALKAAVAGFAGKLDARGLAGGQIPFKGDALHTAARGVLDAIDELHDTVQPALVSMQEDNIAASSRLRAIHLGLVIGITLLAGLLAWLISRLIVNALGKAVEAFERIAAGDLQTGIEIDGHDEPNMVLAALADMRQRLQKMESERAEQFERERLAAAENGRIRTALDKAGSCLTLGDAQGRIVYVNDAAQELFSRHQAALRTAMPGLDATRLVGGSLVSLLGPVGDSQRLLASLSGQHNSDFEAGGRHLRVRLNPVLAADGQRAGTLVEWIDRSEEVLAEQDVTGVVEAALAGDLTRRIVVEGRSGFFAAIGHALNPLLDNVADVIRQIKVASEEVERGTVEISQGNSNLAKRTESQSASLEQTAASMEEMTATVKQNAENSTEAARMATAARQNAERGGKVVSEAVQAMSGINESSHRIAAIIGVIDEIAFQTNLLALNAAVEAARAGEQGRGFAVVATEVRNLAGRSASAAKEIKELIATSVDRVEEGSKLVTQSGAVLQEIVSAVKKVADVVAEIEAANSEQSSGIDQVGKAVTAMDEMTQQNAALVEQAAAASQSMAERARQLSGSVAHYLTGEERAVRGRVAAAA